MSNLVWTRVVDTEDLPSALEQIDRQMEGLVVAMRRLAAREQYLFVDVDVAANQSAVALQNSLGQTFGVPAVRRGFIVGIVVHSNANRTAGQLDVTPTINGTVIIGTATLDNVNVATHAVDISRSATAAFVAGDRIGVKITTDASWAPTTADIVVSVLIEHSGED